MKPIFTYTIQPKQLNQKQLEFKIEQTRSYIDLNQEFSGTFQAEDGDCLEASGDIAKLYLDRLLKAYKALEAKRLNNKSIK